MSLKEGVDPSHVRIRHFVNVETAGPENAKAGHLAQRIFTTTIDFLTQFL